MNLAANLTAAERKRLESIERDLNLVKGRSYTVTFRRRNGNLEKITGRFIRIGRSTTGSIQEGLRFWIHDQAYAHVIDREIVESIEEVA